MINFLCSACAKPLRVADDMVGHRVRCPKCSAVEFVPDLSAQEPESFMSADKPPTQESSLAEYKVLTQKDKWFSGKFDPEKLEQALNAYAKQGWKMKGVATANM